MNVFSIFSHPDATIDLPTDVEVINIFDKVLTVGVWADTVIEVLLSVSVVVLIDIVRVPDPSVDVSTDSNVNFLAVVIIALESAPREESIPFRSAAAACSRWPM